jgi:uncharacterized RDD family membrane protein YckC
VEAPAGPRSATADDPELKLSTAQVVGIVTPEAVVLDLPPAGVATRIVAKLIDLGILGILLYFGTIFLALAGGTSGSFDGGVDVWVQIALAIWFFFVLLIVPMLVESRWHGRTPGKAVLGLRAVTLDGGPIQTRHAMVRGIFQIIDVYALLGLFPALVTSRSQRFGDLAAGTFVLAERNGASPPTPIAFFPPPGWEAYVYALDVGRLSERQYRLVRTYLLRVGGLTPGARVHLATQLADRVAPRVTPQAPHGITAEQFLHCVVSAYQYRNGGFPPPSAIVRVMVPR